MRIEVTQRAALDRDDIIDYYGESSTGADRFITHLNEAFAHLGRWPDSAGRRPQLSRFDVRFWLISPYYIVLSRRPDCLVVTAILHCSRNVSRELRARQGKRSQ